jgi:hypothetical protein
MTENHGYETPSEGSADWHVPLNDNFERIDTDVEIRDTEANLDQYQPNSNAKFLATDTGSVYIGDGQQWQRLGSVTTGQRRLRWGEPGNLQATLDNAGDDSGLPDDGPMEAVACVPGARYTNPIKVPQGVHLISNGATFDIDSDVDVWTLDSGASVSGSATINVDSVSSYTSSAVLVDANQATSTPIALDAGQANTTNMMGEFRIIGDQPGAGMDPTDGAAFELRGAPEPGGYITHCYFGDLQIRGFNNAILCDAQGFLNDNRFTVDAANCNYFFHHCNTSTAQDREAKIWVTNSHIQGDAFQHAFWNELHMKSIRFYGHVEDPQRFQNSIIRGPMMKIFPTARWNFSTQTKHGVEKADWGIGTTVNGIGFLEGDGEDPSVVTNGAEYYGGEFVAFNDPGDGSGDGLYMKGPWQGTNAWIKVSGETVAPSGGNG